MRQSQAAGQYTNALTADMVERNGVIQGNSGNLNPSNPQGVQSNQQFRLTIQKVKKFQVRILCLVLGLSVWVLVLHCVKSR